MRKTVIRIWHLLSHTYTALSMLGWWHAVSAAIIGGLVVWIAWLREYDPIILFVMGLGAFAAMVIIFERISAWRWRNEQSLRVTEEIAEPTEQTRIRYDTPIHKAVDYVALRIDDSDSGESYPTARHALRTAAHEGRITLYGKKKSKGKSDPSRLRTVVPADYWDDQELTLYATASSHLHWIHTGPELGNNKEVIGYSREQYWEVLVSMDEVRKEWPRL